MKPHQLLAAMVVASLLGRSAGLSLPSLFGYTRTAVAKDVEDANEESLEKEQRDPPEHEPTKKPTRPPLLVVPHPADHPLHPHNDPDHPLHPDNLPHLPHLPPLPPLPALPDPLHHRETIHATKTVYAVATEKVTVHPVCMKVVGKHAPPCLPFVPHVPEPQHHHHYHHHGWKDEEGDKEEGEGVISPSKAVDSLQTSAVAELEQPVLLVDGETESGPVEELVGAEGERDGRYVELTPALAASPEQVEIKDEPVEEAGGSGGSAGSGGIGSGLSNMVHNLINHHRPVTLYKTKTIWLTKVDKVLDTRVTATLVPHNCVPVNSHIPPCGLPGAYGPGFQYHGQQHGVYTETLGGHYLPGVNAKDEQAAASDVEETKELPEEEAKELPEERIDGNEDDELAVDAE